MRFALVSCSNYPAGFFNVYRCIVNRPDLDAVVHVGDYIYEYPRYTVDRNNRVPARVMPEGFGTSCVNLIDYRRRYSLYKSDPDLRAAHASCVFLSSFDDHEVTDNWASDTDPKNTPAEIID